MDVPRSNIKFGDMKRMMDASARMGEERIVTNNGEKVGDQITDHYNDVWAVIHVFDAEKSIANNQEVELVKMKIKCVGGKRKPKMQE